MSKKLRPTFSFHRLLVPNEMTKVFGLIYFAFQTYN